VLPTTGTYVVFVDPLGTVTGSISVAVTNQGATAPIISGVSPTIGVAGTAVTVNGSNLTPVSAVQLNASAAVVGAASSTAITFTVPAVTASGRISITTPNGSAVSNDDFFVPPSPYTPSNVASAGRLNVGSATSFSISAANQIALFVFDRIAGQRFTLAFSSNFALAHMQVLRPDGAMVYASGAIYPTSFYFPNVMTATMSGTYTVVFDPDDRYGYVGNGTVTVNDVPPDITGTIVAGGAPFTFVISTPAQNARITFVGTAGQRVALTDTNTTIGYSGFTIQAPDGSQVIYDPLGNNGVLGPVYLPLTGLYNVLVNPFDAYIGSMTLTLYNVDPDVSLTIPTDGTPTTFSQTQWQRAYLTFTGAVGQHFTGTMSGTANSWPYCGRYVYVMDPNWGSMYGVGCGENATWGDRTLTTPGTYTIATGYDWGYTGAYTVRITLGSGLQVTSLTPTSGPVGQAVTISGTGFGGSQGSSTVTFNGVTATVSAWSDTSITAAAPTGATTGPVVVTVNGQASNGVIFTVLPTPNISSLDLASGIVAQSVTITGTNFGASQGSSTVTFNGTAATATSWSATSITTTVPAAATAGPVVVTVGGLASNGSTFTVLNDVTYHLHKEASDITGLFRLRTAAPDAATTTAQSGNIGHSTGEILVKAFATDAGVPGVAGSIPSGSPISITVYMRKTTTNGVMYPRVRVRLNTSTGTLLCQATGSTALSSAVTAYALSCTTGAVTVTASDRIYLWVGVNVTTAPGGNTKGELSIESTNGSTDSLVTVRIPK
jgi:hypothetical protein